MITITDWLLKSSTSAIKRGLAAREGVGPLALATSALAPAPATAAFAAFSAADLLAHGVVAGSEGVRPAKRAENLFIARQVF